MRQRDTTACPNTDQGQVGRQPQIVCHHRPIAAASGSFSVLPRPISAHPNTLNCSKSGQPTIRRFIHALRLAETPLNGCIYALDTLIQALLLTSHCLILDTLGESSHVLCTRCIQMYRYVPYVPYGVQPEISHPWACLRAPDPSFLRLAVAAAVA